MQTILPSRNRWAMVAIAGTIGTMVFGMLAIRRAGFGTDWARIRYICLTGEYRTLIEAGSLPDNVFLPPHLRLDRISYLDRHDTRIAMPPLMDLNQSDKDRVTGFDKSLPSCERTEVTAQIGVFKTRSISMTQSANDRYVKRRLGLSDEDREKWMKEEIAKRAAS